MCGISADVKSLVGDVQFMHYLCKKTNTRVQLMQPSATATCASPSGTCIKERITQYIPCCTYKELQHLDEKLDTETFFAHAVR